MLFPHHRQDPVVACKPSSAPLCKNEQSAGQEGQGTCTPILLLDGAGMQLRASLLVASLLQGFV